MAVAIVVFLGVEGALFYSLIKFRARKGAVAGPDPRQHAPGDRLDRRRRADPRDPGDSHVRQARRDPQPAELRRQRPQAGRRRRRRDGPTNGKALNICVNGQQYIWRYTYTQDCKNAPLDAPFSYEEMVAPVDTTVTLTINAQDVAHSWWIPKLGGKFDAVPGYTNYTWFKIPGKLAGKTFTRPVRRAVRPQPREHDRPRAGRHARAVRAVHPGPQDRAEGRQRRRGRVPQDSSRHSRGRPNPMAARTTEQVLTPAPQVNAQRRRGAAHRLDVLGDHDRPQADRDHVHGPDLRLLHAGRGRGAAHAPAAQPGGQHPPGPRDVQRAVHDARDDDDLPVRRPVHGRLGQLLRAAHDRRPRHGLPAAERALVLAAGRGRASSSTRRCSSPARGGLDVLLAAVLDGLLAQQRRRRVDLPDPPHRHLLAASARSTSTRRSRTCARQAWAGAACRCSSGRSSPTRSC